MTFTTPLALLLFLALLPVFYLGWPRLSYRRLRDTTSLILRVIIVSLVVLALAGMQVVRAADRLAVVFLVDVSDSVSPAAQEQELEYVREAMQSMQVEDLAGVVLFGANATVERQLNTVRELGPVRSVPVTGNTDLAEAIRLGMALFPPDTARRMVLLSDGLPTVGDTDAAAQLASAVGIEISYVPVERETLPEVQVSDVRAPASVNTGQQFDLSLTVTSEENTAALLTVFAGGEVIQRQEVQLTAGTNNYTLPLTADGTGFRDFRVMVEPQGSDGFYQNNQLSTFSQVVGPPRILVVQADEEEGRYLVEALRENGLAVDTATPNELPVGVAALAQYSTVILANIPASSLSVQRMRALQVYVRDFGGGLVAVGGPNAYGPGGYFETPLEETLPVSTRLADQQRVPQLTIVYVLDRSGSMSAVGPGGVDMLEMAKEAINRSIDFLQPTDRAGIVSFDADAFWIAEVQNVNNRVGLQQLVGTIRSGGGTDILAGMRLTAENLRQDPAPRKHIILLTDGGADPSGLVDLTEDLYTNFDITTSVVAMGVSSPNQTFLDEMAAAGGGNYHQVEVVESIPTIFTLEAVLATRSYILEEPFTPRIGSTNPMIEGITSAPELLGYVATTPKQTAQVVLYGSEEYDDPLLASWQYGLGRSVAFTSDATARWGANWVSWDDYARFWSQVARWTITEGTSQNLETRVQMEGEQARIIVDARDSDGEFLNGLNLNASVIDPSLDGSTLPLSQVAPGRYEAVFTPESEGAYFLALDGAMAETRLSQRTGWVMSYSPEYSLRPSADDIGLLSDIAALTGGRSLATIPSEVFAHNLPFRTASTPLWPLLLLVAAVLVPIDVAVRRLVITRADIARVRAAIESRRPQTMPTSERMSDLMGAKARAQQRTDAEPSPTNTAAALRSRRETPREAPVEVPASLEPRRAGRHTPPPSASSVKAPPPSPDNNIAGKLLQKRRPPRPE